MENRNYILAIAICNFDYWRDVCKEYSVEVKFITMVLRVDLFQNLDQFFHTTGFVSFL